MNHERYLPGALRAVGAADCLQSVPTATLVLCMDPMEEPCESCSFLSLVTFANFLNLLIFFTSRSCEIPSFMLFLEGRVVENGGWGGRDSIQKKQL